ncbi:DUF3887 domain-containing protein [[Clostridium] dakarense]|uniref:DUF3887 domain-containing protein n=1 Tax=Faecalimicrobium dakarense TaxID=1301100 RepID=UPI0004B36961|nr:DUF3887 domain-containing protein [[Clostridium] dakarense]
MKRVKLLLVALLTGVILVGCSSSKLSDAFDEATLKSRGQEVVNLFLNEEFDKMIETMSDKMKAEFKPEDLKVSWDSLKGKLGEFEEISKEGVVGIEGYAKVIEITKFKKGKIQFEVVYNENMEIDGFFIK